MNKYTANYAYTNPNFVIENLAKNLEPQDIKTTYVIKNILQRGMPTTLSKFLQRKLGAIHKDSDFNERFLMCPQKFSRYSIYLDKSKLHFNSLHYITHLLENIFPKYLGTYAFLTPLFCVNENAINCTHIYSEFYSYKKVHLYLPCLKLAILIFNDRDGDDLYFFSDYLMQNNIHVITLHERNIQENNLHDFLYNVQNYFLLKEKTIALYHKFFSSKIDDKIINKKLIPTAIMRFELLFLELIERKILSKDSIKIKIYAHENLGDFASLAIKDVLLFYRKLYLLSDKVKVRFPKISITYVDHDNLIKDDANTILVDFSLFKRLDFEYLHREDVIFVRTDYFDNVNETNYFKVSTTDPINYNIKYEDLKTLEFFLLNIFDKKRFKEGQFPIIANALSLNDTIGLLPTGGGKSISYQLPCLLEPCINFVVCPIKSLMYDQKENLDQSYITNTSFITSDLDKDTRYKIEKDFVNGKYLLVWISPERFQIPKFRNIITNIQKYFSIAYAIIDEVHCLSEWGHDFRTSYLNLAKTIDKLSNKDSEDQSKIKFIGLTATASVNVLKDVQIEFSRQRGEFLAENIKTLLNYSRDEINFEVITVNGKKEDALFELIDDLKRYDGFLTKDSDKTCIIFTPFVNGKLGCFDLYKLMENKYADSIGWYSGNTPKDIFDYDSNYLNGLSFSDYKQQTHNKFKDDKFKILIATKAFGMGIDKENIYYTIHYGLPSSIEALYQEAGRAGRWNKSLKENKNKKAKCFILHNQEKVAPNKLNRLFEKDATFEDMNYMLDRCKYIGKDVFRQIFLFINNKHDIQFDTRIIKDFFNTYYKRQTRIDVLYSDIEMKFHINYEDFESYIYRLSLLGIVSDWTSDFNSRYTIQFENDDKEHILKSLKAYIGKYEPKLDIESRIRITDGSSFLEKCVNFLLNWIFLNIVYNRKQSLKTLNELCEKFKNPKEFKKSIDSYFTFNDKTFILQHIAENPTDLDKYFQVLPCNTPLDKKELESLKISLSRFLESYRNNIGLNILSSIIRLSLDEFDDNDGRYRLQIALKEIAASYKDLAKDLILSILNYFDILLTREQKLLFCHCLVRETEGIFFIQEEILKKFKFDESELIALDEESNEKEKLDFDAI